MAGENRTKADLVGFLRAIEETPWAFEFYSTLRRIECLDGDGAGFGRSLKPSEDPVRIGQQPSMAFSPAEIEAYRPGKPGHPGTLGTRFHGMFGPNGALPLHITEYARDRLRNAQDATLTRFVDMFQHRMLSLFYRAWANAQPTVNFDHATRDRFALYIGALFGAGGEAMSGRDALPDSAKRFFAGRLSAMARNAEGLEDMLADYFEVPVRIVEFFGEWLDLHDEDRLRLGQSRRTGSVGLNAAIGAQVWGAQHKIRIIVGPVDFERFERLLPGTSHMQALVAMVRLYAGDEMAWDLNLILAGDEVPDLELGVSGRLGQTTWLGGDTSGRDRGDAVLNPMAAPEAYDGPPVH